MPVEIGRLSISFSLSFSPGLNSGVPPPRMTGFTAMRNSSINPCGIRLAARSALPNRKISLALLALQPGDGPGDVIAEHLRVVPIGFLHRAGEDVFRRRIHEIGDLAGRARPVARHQFVGDAAEQQSAGGVQLLDRQLLQFLAPDVGMPGNIPVRTFDETVQRHQIPHDQLRHRGTPLKPIAICNWLYPEITGAILQAVFLAPSPPVWNRT